MKTTVTFTNFIDAFQDRNRNDNFSYEGKRALFDYLEEYEDSTGEETELDVIALCCDYNEYDSWDELKENYSEYFAKYNVQTLEDLQDHTTVLEFECRPDTSKPEVETHYIVSQF